ncbi:MAG: hypothetical protein IK017_11080 [Paludibacteraceae bacterium]|nr:hypothetical protein [Paludibacteraceae bacterium]
MIFMKYLVYILFTILLWGCSSSHEMQSQSTPKHMVMEVAKNETLINVRGKMADSGVIGFLRYENGDFNFMSYSYYAKDGEISCYFNYSKTCETNDSDISGRVWHTASEFQKHEILKPYLSRISEDFMEVSNERKIQMLDSFIHVHKKSVDNEILNKKEGKKLNAIFHDKTNGFDFIGKKVGYIGSVGKPGEKGYYLYRKTKKTVSSDFLHNATLHLFNEQQKIESGGYDAAIVYRRKDNIPIEDIIKRLTHD